MTISGLIAGAAPVVLGELAPGTIKAAVILAGAAALTRVMRRQSSAARYVVWMIAMGIAAVMPFATRMLPEWNVALPSALSAPLAHVGGIGSVAVTERPARTSHEPDGALAGIHDASTRSTTFAAGQSPSFSTLNAPSVSSRSGEPRSVGSLVVWLYLIVTIGLSLRLAAGLLAISRLTRAAAPITGPSWVSLFEESSRSIGLRRRVRLLSSGDARVPMTWGVFDPVVLLTPDHDEWTVARRRSVLRHELAHVARWDAATQIAAQICCAVYWFNPLIWVGARALRAERERACDDRVLTAGMRAGDYAGELLDIARASIGTERHGVALAMARRSQIEGRLLSILDPGVRRDSLRARSAVAICAAAVAFAVPLAAFRPIPQVVPTPRVVPPTAPAVPTPRGVPQGPPRPPTPPSAPVPTAVVPIASSQVVPLCGPSKRETSSSHSSSHDDGRLSTWDVSWNGDGCDVEMHSIGAVTFNDDLTDVASIAPGGSMQFVVRQGNRERTLDVRPEGSGLKQTYAIDGKSATYDDAARAWLAAFLLELDRHTGFRAVSRASAILREKGAAALLDEIDLLLTDNARAVYYQQLAGYRRLSRSDVLRGVRMASTTMTSDYELGRVLGDFSDKFPPKDPELAMAFVDAAGHLSSDHERSVALVSIAEGNSVSGEAQLRIINLAARMSSEYEITTVLVSLAEHNSLTDDARQAYTRAADRLTSSYSRRRAINALKR